jgi:hypothetical protein
MLLFPLCNTVSGGLFSSIGPQSRSPSSLCTIVQHLGHASAP